MADFKDVWVSPLKVGLSLYYEFEDKKTKELTAFKAKANPIFSIVVQIVPKISKSAL